MDPEIETIMIEQAALKQAERKSREDGYKEGDPLKTFAVILLIVLVTMGVLILSLVL